MKLRDLLKQTESTRAGLLYVIAAVVFFAFLIACRLYSPSLDINEWLGFVHIRPETAARVFKSTEYVGFGWTALEIAAGQERIAEWLRLLAAQIEGGAPFVKAAGVVRTYMHRTVVATQTSPGSPWWEDGPVYGLFLWLAYGSPALAERARTSYEYVINGPLSALPMPSTGALIEFPMMLITLMFFCFILIWLWRCLRVLRVLIGGLFPPFGIPYWQWCRPQLLALNEQIEQSFLNKSMDTGARPTLVGLKDHLLAYGVVFLLGGAICWLGWPGFVYLLLLSGVSWILSKLLRLLALLCVVGVKVSRLPRIGPVLAGVSICVEHAIGAH